MNKTGKKPQLTTPSPPLDVKAEKKNGKWVSGLTARAKAIQNKIKIGSQRIKDSMPDTTNPKNSWSQHKAEKNLKTVYQQSMLQIPVKETHGANYPTSDSLANNLSRNHKDDVEKKERIHTPFQANINVNSTTIIGSETSTFLKDLCEKMRSYPGDSPIYINGKKGLTIEKSKGPDFFKDELTKSFSAIQNYLNNNQIKVANPEEFPLFMDRVSDLIENNPNINILIGAMEVADLSSDKRNEWLEKQDQITVLPRTISDTNEKDSFEDRIDTRVQTSVPVTSKKIMDEGPYSSVKDLCDKMRSYPKGSLISPVYTSDGFFISKSEGSDYEKNASDSFPFFLQTYFDIFQENILDPFDFPRFIAEVSELIEKKFDINILIEALEHAHLSSDERDDWLKTVTR